MNEKNDILNELSTISPAVANIANTNVFAVPGNYFSDFPAHILQLVQEDIRPDFLKTTNSAGFVPTGYFDGLAGNILNRIKAETAQSSADEIRSLSPSIAAIGNKNIFTAPQDYFETLSAEVLVYANTPEGVAEEMSALSASIAAIGNKNVFEVPEGYFENLNIDGVATASAPAKVVEMKKRSGMVRYLSAAVVAGIIGLTIINIPVNKPTTVATISEPVMAEAQKIIRDKSFDAELNTVSEKDIEAYLKESGRDVNAALVASATDENNLPEAVDYILNDNTLDEFLNKINVNN